MLAVYGAYLVLVNVLLLSGGLGWLLHTLAPALRLETGHSYSLWFFRVELRDLHLSAMTQSFHLELEVPRASVQIRPDQLVSSTFATSHLRGDEFVFRLRPNYASLPEARREALPDLVDASEPLIDEPSRPEDLWGYDFRGLDIGFAELWISEFRSRGLARVRGGFRVQPQRSVAVYQTAVEFRQAAVHFGRERTLAERFRLDAQIELPESRFEDGLRWSEARLDAQGEVRGVSLAWLEAYSTGADPWRLSGGPLSAEWQARVQHDQSTAQLEISVAGARVGKGDVSANTAALVSGRWQGKLSELPAGRLLDGVIDAQGVELDHPDADVENWSFRLDFPELTVERGPWSVQGPFFASAEDARPIVRLLGVPDLPPPLARFLQLPDLGVVGFLEVSQEAQAVSIDRATSDSVDITGEVVRVPRATYAALLLEADPLCVGVYSGPEDSGVDLRAGSEWLRKKLRQLPNRP